MYKIFLISFVLFSFNCNILFGKEFFDQQKRGVNVFNYNVTQDLVKSAKKYNIEFIRFAIDRNSPLFIVNDKNDYKKLNLENLKQLKKSLDLFEKENLPIILTVLSLPGALWKQHNKGKNDFRIYLNDKFVEQASEFWYDLIKELKDYKNIIGYNILNEPRYERFDNIEYCTDKHQDVLFKIYQKIIQKIRKIDKEKSIILDLSSDSSVDCFKHLKPIKEDEKIIYSFHMYEPMQYTFSHAKWNKDKNKYTKYPVLIDDKLYNAQALKKYLNVVANWQKKFNIPSNKILVGEFGANRKNKNIELYFKDLIDIFDQNKWHWAFYSFEEDGWNVMDYELGNSNLSNTYWNLLNFCEKVNFKNTKCYNINKKYYKKNKIFDILLDKLDKKAHNI